MAQTNGEELLNELDQVLIDNTEQNASADADSDSSLPFESLDEYGTDAVLFSEMSLKMLNRVDDVFDLAVKYNRHSSQYPKLAVQLDKGIRYLAGSCLTKIALEKNRQSFPELSQLTTEKLYRMASVHFRKIDRALSEYLKEKHEMSDELLELEFRYYNLLDRLRATEAKIKKYQYDSIDGDESWDPYRRGMAFSKSKENCDFSAKAHEASAFRQANAFSPLKAFQPGNPVTDKRDSIENKHVETDRQTSDLNPSLLNSPVPCADNKGIPANLAGIIKPEDRHWVEILSRAAQRNAGLPDVPEGKAAYSFTKGEMRELVNDSRFCEVYPKMSGEIREFLKQCEDSG
ncbi:MAG: hypothetical protein II969_02675 [Anaerolineaceae bacterium]|nr:hypothetical protein [Anaerolineaceae bacterium]